MRVSNLLLRIGKVAPPGFEPATYRSRNRLLNHSATAPLLLYLRSKICAWKWFILDCCWFLNMEYVTQHALGALMNTVNGCRSQARQQISTDNYSIVRRSRQWCPRDRVHQLYRQNIGSRRLNNPLSNYNITNINNKKKNFPRPMFFPDNDTNRNNNNNNNRLLTTPNICF